MIIECPGSRKFRYPEPENIDCSFCGTEIEIWTDEFETACPGCGKKTMRKMGQNCFGWCKYAKECRGGS